MTLVSFQDYINKILTKKYNIFIIFYLDNIFIDIKNQVWSCIDAIL